MRILVIGSGAGVIEELSQINRQGFDAIIGINRAAIMFAPVDYHISLHPRIYAERKVSYFIAHQEVARVDEVFPYEWKGCTNSGSSGLYAVKYALEKLKADEVVLCGVGMDERSHTYNEAPWKYAKKYQQSWLHVADELRGRVTSMGGWTAELLGRPKLECRSGGET